MFACMDNSTQGHPCRIRCDVVCIAVTVFLSMKEFPYDDDNDDDYSTIGLMVQTSTPRNDRTSTSQPSTAADNDGQKNDEKLDDDLGGEQVVGRVRVRRDAFEHLDTQHVDELWRRTEELLERSAVSYAKRRLQRRRRDMDYWRQLVTLLDQLDELDKITVRLRRIFVMAVKRVSNYVSHTVCQV